jgi:hypothetical protein
VVWRWQARFMAEGVEGLTRDKTRKDEVRRAKTMLRNSRRNSPARIAL